LATINTLTAFISQTLFARWRQNAAVSVTVMLECHSTRQYLGRRQCVKVRNNEMCYSLIIQTVAMSNLDWLSSRARWLILNTSVCRVYCIVTGSCHPFKRSTQKRFELNVGRELFVAVVCEQLSW